MSEAHPYLDKNVWTRIIVMCTCAFSVAGSLLMILSFACCKDLRGRGRQILTNLSIMDLGVAIFNLLGAAVYFDKFYYHEMCYNCTTFSSTPAECIEGLNTTVLCPKSASIQYLCLIQAAFSHYFTHGSVLWTNALCFYLYFRIVHSSTIARYSLYASYLFCYTVPLLVTLWLGFTGRLGYSPYESSGWCSIILIDPLTMKRDIYASVFGYNLWIVITFIFVPILSCAVHINVRNKVKNTALYRRSDKLLLALLSIDHKFLLIPLAFVILRLWSFLGDILHLYAGKMDLKPWLSFTLIILAGIGDSGQGITNSLLFLFFTKKFCDAARRFCCGLVLKRTQSLSIQISNGKQDKDEVSKSLLDSTSISPHDFTYRSFENTTPVSLDVEK